MTIEELLKVLMDWMATDSGSCPEGQLYGLVEYGKAAAQIKAMPPKERNEFLSAFVRGFLEPEMVAQGYGREDAKEAAEFISDTLLY
jgi:hypothetical protein